MKMRQIITITNVLFSIILLSGCSGKIDWKQKSTSYKSMTDYEKRYFDLLLKEENVQSIDYVDADEYDIWIGIKTAHGDDLCLTEELGRYKQAKEVGESIILCFWGGNEVQLRKFQNALTDYRNRNK